MMPSLSHLSMHRTLLPCPEAPSPQQETPLPAMPDFLELICKDCALSKTPAI